MTKAEKWYNFWTSFGVPAYEENSVPSGEDAPKYPYITYQLILDSFGNPVFPSASVWDKDRDGHSALRFLVQKSEEIAERITLGGITLPIDGGMMWIQRGSPWCQIMEDPNDDKVKRINLNISAEYMTAD